MRPVASIALLLLTTACAGRAPPPALSAAALRARTDAAHSAVQGYSAEARLTYFGPEGRLKGTASLVVRRPDQLRYDLQGPHGGVLVAVACDGAHLAALDFKTARLIRGNASAAHFDQLLGLAPLGLDGRGWVALLFGEVAVPPEAELAAGDNGPTWRWARGSQRFAVELDAASGRVRVATVWQGDTLVSEVRVQAWDERALPQELRIRVPASAVEAEVRLRDVAYDPPMDPAAFVLVAPRGVVEETLP